MYFTSIYEYYPYKLKSKLRWHTFNMHRAYHQSCLEEILKYAEFNTLLVSSSYLLSLCEYLEQKVEEGSEFATLKTWT